MEDNTIINLLIRWEKELSKDGCNSKQIVRDEIREVLEQFGIVPSKQKMI